MSQEKFVIFRLSQKNNEKLDELYKSIDREYKPEISKFMLYAVAAAYAFSMEKREPVSEPVDIARGEFLARPEYQNVSLLIESIWAYKKDVISGIDKYRLFEEYANAGANLLYELFKESEEDLEHFIDNFELRVLEEIQNNPLLKEELSRFGEE